MQPTRSLGPDGPYLLALTLLLAAVVALARAESGALARGARLAESVAVLNERTVRLEERARVGEERAGTAEALASERQSALERLGTELTSARRSLHRSLLARAAEALAAGDPAAARMVLEQAPASERRFAHGLLERTAAAVDRALALGEHEPTALALGGGVAVVGTASGALLLLDPDDGAVRAVAEVLGEEVLCVALAASGGSGAVAVGGESGELALVDLATRGVLERARVEARVTALACARDRSGASVVLVGDVDGRLHRWTPGAPPEVLEAAHDDTVNALALAPTRDLFVSVGDDERVLAHALDPEDLRALDVPPRALSGHDDWVRDAEFDASGGRLATVGDDGRLLVHVRTREGFEPPVVSATADEALLVASFDPLAGPLAAADTGRLVGPGARARALALAPGGTLVAAAFEPGRGSVLHLDAAGTLRRRTLGAGLLPRFADRVGDDVRAVALSPAGRALAAACGDGTLVVWSSRDASGEPPWRGTAVERTVTDAHARPVGALAFSADGTRLASGDGDGLVLVRATGATEPLLRLEAGGRVDRLAFRADGAGLLVVRADGRALAFDAAGAIAWRSPGTPSFAFRGLARADGEAHGWVGDAGTVRLWELSSGERLHALRLRAVGLVDDAALAREAPLLALISNTTSIRVLALSSGAELARVGDATSGFRTLALDPDGRRLATASGSGRVRVHDTDGGGLLVELPPRDAAALALAFDDDGDALAVGFADGEVLVW